MKYASLLAMVLSGCVFGDHRFDHDRMDAGAGVTRAILDWSGPLAEPGHFFDAPFPSLMRTMGDGRLVWDGLADLPDTHGLASAFTSARAKIGTPLRPVVYVRFDGPLTALSASDHEVEGVDGIYLIEIPLAPEQPRRLPVVAQTLASDGFVSENVLAIAPAPGVVLRPSTYYGVYVSTDLLDAAGRPVGSNSELADLRAGAPALSPAAQMLAPLWPTIPPEITLAGPAAATVFRTGDPLGVVRARADAAVSTAPVTVSSTAVALVTDAARANADLCELTGTVSLPRFQIGTPPFSSGGAISSPVAVQASETVAFTISVPQQLMPAGGYPLALSIGELDDRHDVAVAPVTNDGIPGDAEGRRFGRGIAFPLARAGIATVSVARPQGKDRGDLRTSVLALPNLPLVAGNDQQAVLELRLLREALSSLTIPVATFTGCLDPMLLGSATEVSFDTTSTAIHGHGQGAGLALLAAFVDPSVRAVAATGARGGLAELATVDYATALSSTLATSSTALSRLHPVIAILDAAIEEVDPQVLASRLLAGALDTRGTIASLHAIVASDLEVRLRDGAALARAFGAPLVGTVAAPLLTELVARGGLATASYPVAAPADASIEAPAPPAPSAEHDSIFHDRGLRYQMTCTFKTALAGTPVIVAPVDRDDAYPCD